MIDYSIDTLQLAVAGVVGAMSVGGGIVLWKLAPKAWGMTKWAAAAPVKILKYFQAKKANAIAAVEEKAMSAQTAVALQTRDLVVKFVTASLNDMDARLRKLEESAVAAIAKAAPVAPASTASVAAKTAPVAPVIVPQTAVTQSPPAPTV